MVTPVPRHETDNDIQLTFLPSRSPSRTTITALLTSSQAEPGPDPARCALCDSIATNTNTTTFATIPSTESTNIASSVDHTHPAMPTNTSIADSNSTSIFSYDTMKSETSIASSCSCIQTRTRATERALVKKLDMCLFPCLLGMCLFQSVDRGCIG